MLRNNHFFWPIGCAVLSEPKKSLFPLQPHRRTFRVVHAYVSELAATTCSGGQPGNRIGFTLLTLHWVSQLEEKRGWSAPEFCLSPVSISAVATADPGRQLGSMEPQQNVKYRHAWGSARATQEAAVVEGCALIMLSSDEHREDPAGEFLLPTSVPSPLKAAGAVMLISEHLMPPCHLAGPALSPTVLVALYLAQYPQPRPLRWPQSTLAWSAGWIWPI